MMTKQRSRRQRGVTLMEMMVVVAIFSVIFIISYTLLEDTVKTSLFLEEHNDLPVYGQAAVNAIQRELLQTRTVFEGTATSFGPGYFSALTFPATFPLLAGSQLPVLNPTGTLVPDSAATRYTGNVLLIARQLPPAIVNGLSIGCATGASKNCSLAIDRYQFEVFYLTKVTGSQNFAATGYYIDIIQAKSVIYADYSQLNQWVSLGPSSTDKTSVATALSGYKDPFTNVSQPTTQAWDSSVAVTSAFYTLTGSLGFTAIANPKIALTAAKLIPGLAGGRVSGKMAYTVGYRPSASRFNLSTDVTKPDGTILVKDPIPKYAVFDSTQPLFPSGLEFLMVGPAGSRRILSRVVIMAQYVGHIASKEAQVITSGSS
jgi:prepilin-type N-terminal cleavage/methylation domain-containing protein